HIAREMEPQKTLRDISETIEQFARLQALLSKLNIPDLNEVIADLDNLLALLKSVCLDASHYLNSLGWQARQDALQNMITNLRESKEFASLNRTSSRKDTTQHELDELSANWRKSIPRRATSVRFPTNLQHAVLSVIDRWEGAAQHELDKLQQEPRKTDQI